MHAALAERQVECQVQNRSMTMSAQILLGLTTAVATSPTGAPQPQEQQLQPRQRGERRIHGSLDARSFAPALLLLLLASPCCLACKPVHSISPASAGRTGIKVQMNLLSDAGSLDRLLAFTVPWLKDVQRTTTEVNVFFGLGSEDPLHVQQLPVDNVVYLGGNTPAERFISLVAHVTVLSSCEVEWFIFVDDDTLFFPANLPAVLRRYNPDDELYIGNGSEERMQVAMHGWFAQGGGGIIASRGLLRGFEQHMADSGCLHNATAVHGDERFRDCVTAKGVQLTVEPALHQMDMRGDLSGFMEGYAAMTRPLLSLHHLGMSDVQLMPGRSNAAAAAALIRASHAMPRSFLRRFVLRLQRPGNTIILTAGYSVQVIPRYVTDTELQQTESSMDPWRLPSWDHPDFKGYVFPTRAKERAKSSYYFLDSYPLLGPMHVYGDASGNSLMVVCSPCKGGAPICAKPASGIQAGMLVMIDPAHCEA